ncbi:MAG: N-formylglutamate deformylase [Alphaproteobacteria bacterium]|nr:N-formylglutamate deformylase [Alphaproteobacteria bacterium]
MPSWVEVKRGDAPLIVSMPHAGIELAPEMDRQVVSTWLARKDTDWHIEKLYDFAPGLGATVVRMLLSRTVIDVNRDPSGASLYPGQATTELCPTTTFDGEPLYRSGLEPKKAEISRRRAAYFDPYHAVLNEEIARLRARHRKVVLYEAHSIRSFVPRLFSGQLPDFNIGTNDGQSCDGALTFVVERICDASGFFRVTNGRFKGGWTTRHYGIPAEGVHAIQMELSCRCYLHEPDEEHWGSGVPRYDRDNWPPAYDEQHAAPIRVVLPSILRACIGFASDT